MDRLFAALKGRRPSFQAGYSLIEVMVAGIVIVAVVVGVFEILSNGSLLNRREMLRRRVFQELERVLEDKTYSYESSYYLTLATTGGSYVPLPQAVTLDDQGSTPLTVFPQIKVDALNYNFNEVTIPAKMVTVKINYTDKDGISFTDSLQTITTLVDYYPP